MQYKSKRYGEDTLGIAIPWLLTIASHFIPNTFFLLKKKKKKIRTHHDSHHCSWVHGTDYRAYMEQHPHILKHASPINTSCSGIPSASKASTWPLKSQQPTRARTHTTHQEDRRDGVLLPVQQREQRGEGEEAAAEEGEGQAPDRQDPQQPRGTEQRQRLQSSGSQQLHKGTKLQLKYINRIFR